MTDKDLRIIFMGTPEFAVPTLARLIETGLNVVAVVTQPDKPVGRHGSQLQAPPVKQFAIEHGLPVLQPEKMKDLSFVEQLRSYHANLQIVVAFRMLPEIVWAMPEYGTFNVHAALLPNYRGAAPINWAIINGETLTGVTTFFLDHNIDTGRIIRQKPFPIPDTADVEYVYDGLMNLGADICIETVRDIVVSGGRPESIPQPTDAKLSPAPKIFKDTCRINWRQPAKKIYDFIRGLSPVPGAWTTLQIDGGETVLKIYATTKTDIPVDGLPAGTVVLQSKHLYIATADTLLQIDQLQPAGKRRMAASDFANGLKKAEELKVIS